MQNTSTQPASLFSMPPPPSYLSGPPRVIVVLNYLRDIKEGDTVYEREFLKSYGCVYSAMRRVLECGLATKAVWIGGKNSDDDETEVIHSKENDQNLTVSIPISKDDVALYYAGFCKSFLWTILHYEVETLFKRKEWEAYKRINQRFAEAIVDIYEPGDLILIQDYYFMLLPLLLRQKLPSAQISFFLHAPFPTSELFRVLVVREELLKGLLGADLIGFQTWDYARHFISACTRILKPDEVETTHKGVTILMADGTRRYVSVVVCPTGIDPTSYERSRDDPEVEAKVEEMKQRFKGLKVIVARDRLDVSSGIVQKLLAYERLLQEHPQWHKKIVFLQVCVKPDQLKTREALSIWKNLNHTINELVGKINGKFGTPDYCPLIYSTNPITWSELCALYRLADVLAITPLRAGLNLTPYEYIVCQANKPDGPGVVLLSEFAGASQSLSGCLRVNPWDTEQLVKAFKEALTMDIEERKERHRHDLSYVQTANALTWANTCMSELRHVNLRRRMSRISMDPVDIKSPGFRIKIPPRVDVNKIISHYHRAKKRLLFLDYDGTLVPIVRVPKDAVPQKNVLDLLTALASDPRNTVFVISGRDRNQLEEWLGHIPIGLAAEHGCFYRPTPQLAAALSSANSSPRSLSPASSPNPSKRSNQSVVQENGNSNADGNSPRRVEWESLVKNVDDSWRKVIRDIFEDYRDRTPGSEIENKTINITWHYRNADANYADWVAKELSAHLTLGVASRMPIEILSSKKAIEVRPKGINKGTIVRHILAHQHLIPDANNVTGSPFDFVLCIGDDRTDEDMFIALQEPDSRIYPEHHYTIVVEDKSSEARYSIRRQADVLTLLDYLVNPPNFKLT